MEAVDRWLRPDHVELLFHVGGLPHYDEAVRGWAKIYMDEFPHRSSDDHSESSSYAGSIKKRACQNSETSDSVIDKRGKQL